VSYQISSSLLQKASAIRLAFFDIDGTLLDSQGQILLPLRAQIARIQRLGIKTAIASGRPLFAAQYVIDELALVDAGMFHTGAHLYHPAQSTELAASYLTTADACALLAAAKVHKLYCEVYTATGFYLAEPAPIAEVHAQHLRVAPQLAALESLVNTQPIFKFLIGVKPAEQGDLISQLELLFPQLIFARAYLSAYPEWQFASVISGVATKADAFARLLSYHNVAANEVIAFGDAESDMDFLRMAGIGIAMGNARTNVQAVADWVTKTADDAGVAFALEQLITNSER
jgi:5-amino-6-(5-phospho-D-ribitylamino)uracil phosphatase